MDESEYKITPEDVQSMLKYLRLNVPEHATPEKAVYLLEQRYVHYKNLEELYPELIEDILEGFEQR